MIGSNNTTHCSIFTVHRSVPKLQRLRRLFCASRHVRTGSPCASGDQPAPFVSQSILARDLGSQKPGQYPARPSTTLAVETASQAKAMLQFRAIVAHRDGARRCGVMLVAWWGNLEHVPSCFAAIHGCSQQAFGVDLAILCTALVFDCFRV